MILSTHASLAVRWPPVSIPPDTRRGCRIWQPLRHRCYPALGLSGAVNRGRKSADNRGLRLDRAALVDLPFIGADARVGLGLALWLFATADSMYVIALGAMAAMIADPLQFVHSLLPREPLSTLQRFHEWIHSKRRLTLEWGLSSQIASLRGNPLARGFAA